MIDPFTIKPLDADTILASAKATGGHIITVEDHYKEGGWCGLSWSVCVSVWIRDGVSFCTGGLGEAVLSAVGHEQGIVVTRLAVTSVPRSGKPQELLDFYKISAKHIANAVRQKFAN